MNLYSNVGQVIVDDVTSPNWMDLSPGLRYSITLVNTTDAAITAGTFTIQTTVARADDPCAPDDAAWHDLIAIPECDALPGAITDQPATLTLSEAQALPPRGVCQFAAPCPEPFIRVVVDGGAGVLVLGVLNQLRGSGMTGMVAA